MLLFYPPIIIHDWVVAIGRWRFGIREFEWLGRDTTIYAGRASFETKLSAYEALFIFVLTTLIAVGVLAFLIAKFCTKRVPNETKI